MNRIRVFLVEPMSAHVALESSVYPGELASSSRGIASLAFSPDGQLLAAGLAAGDNNAAQVFRTSDGTLARTIQGASSTDPNFVGIFKDGTTLVVGTRSSTQVIGLPDFTPLRTINAAYLSVYQEATPMAISADGKLLVTRESNPNEPRMPGDIGICLKAGQVIGSTTADGRFVESPGWSQDRPIGPEDIAAAIYSALGINYTTIRRDDPLDRGFEYVPSTNAWQAYPIRELFI